MKKLFILFIVLFGFQNFLKADDPFDAFVEIFPESDVQEKLREGWDQERAIVLKKYVNDQRSLPENFWDRLMALGEKVRKLNLAINKLTLVPDLSSLSELRELNLSCNELSSLQGLSALTKLQELHLMKNHFSELPGLQALTRLEVLDISFNKFVKAPDLSGLSFLWMLSLMKNQLAELHLPSLPKLQLLNLTNNGLTKFPDFSAFSKLQTLLFSNNQLVEVPLGYLPAQLKDIGLDANYLSKQPQVPAGCRLSFGKQKQKDFAFFVTLFPENMRDKMHDDWKQGQNIDLRDYGQLPAGFWKVLKNFIQEVRLLDLSGCHLVMLPDFIGDAENLETLVIANNPLEHLPRTMDKLSKTHFYLDEDHAELFDKKPSDDHMHYDLPEVFE